MSAGPRGMFQSDGSVLLRSVLYIGFLAKNQWPNDIAPDVVIPKLALAGRQDVDQLNCPVHALKFYLYLSHDLRQGKKVCSYHTCLPSTTTLQKLLYHVGLCKQ